MANKELLLNLHVREVWLIRRTQHLIGLHIGGDGDCGGPEWVSGPDPQDSLRLARTDRILDEDEHL